MNIRELLYDLDPFFPGPSGGAGGVAAFSTQTALALTNGFSFTGIPTSGAGSGHSLLVVGEMGTNRAGQTSGFIGMQFNGDSGANYFWQQATANGATVAAANSTANTTINWTSSGGTGADACGFTVWIPNYIGTTFLKKAFVSSWSESGGSTLTNFEQHACFWNNTAAINRIDIGASIAGSGQLVIGSTATVYIL